MEKHSKSTFIWRLSNGRTLSCVEKIRVMKENIEELTQMLQDAYEDALLMDVDSCQVKEYFVKIINNLHNPYQK